jgi:hypothetical protein
MESTPDIRSIHQIAADIGAMPTEVYEAAHTAQIEPALRVNGRLYYSAQDEVRIKQQLQVH